MELNRFYSDNPFRVIGVGSGESQQALSRGVGALTKKLAVGLPFEPPFEAELGPSNFEDLPNTVRSLATDGVQRTVYRLLWPLRQTSIPLINEELPEVESALPPEEIDQLRFIAQWVMVLLFWAKTEVAESFTSWRQLIETDGTFCERLIALLQEDDGLSEDDARDQVQAAVFTVTSYLLETVSTISSLLWGRRKFAEALEVAGVLMDSPFGDRLKGRALAPIIAVGNQAESQLAELMWAGQYNGLYVHGTPLTIPDEVVRLDRLTSLVLPYHPAARSWETCVTEWNGLLVAQMRGMAIKMNGQGQDDKAMEVISLALSVVRDPLLRNTLKQDLSSLRTATDYAGILPVKAAPSLTTMNGLGSMLYGHEPFPPDANKYFAVRYFTVLYFPLFPIDRYLVEKGPQGWRFFGITRWTREMKIHLGVMSAAVVLLVIYLSNQPPSAAAVAFASSNLPSSYSSGSSLPGASSTTGQPPPGGYMSRDNSVEQAPEFTKADSLHDKIDTLKTELTTDGMAIDTEAKSLDSLKARLKHDRPLSSSEGQIEAYNRQFADYELRRKQYNDRVDKHNSKLKAEQELAHQYNELADKINRGE